MPSQAKAADYPRSFTRQEIFHARSSDNPRSTRMAGTGPVFVSICNSKRVVPPLSVTDRDITQRSQLTSHSVTARTVFSLFVLQIETNRKRDGRQPDGTPPTKKRALSHKGAEPETFVEPVTGIEPATH